MGIAAAPMLWTAFITWPFMACVQFMCARIGMVTGRGLAGAFHHKYPRPLILIAALALFVANSINVGADLSGMAEAAEMLTRINSHFLVVFFGARQLGHRPGAEAAASFAPPTVSVSEPPAVATSAAPPAGPSVVHVAGAVRRAGVYRMSAGARVEDALMESPSQADETTDGGSSTRRCGLRRGRARSRCRLVPECTWARRKSARWPRESRRILLLSGTW